MRANPDTEASLGGAVRRPSTSRGALALLLVVGAFALQVASSSPASAAGGDLTLVSTADAGRYSFSLSISASGRHVGFYSNSADIVAGDTDTSYDVFVRDVTTGAVTLADTSDTGTKANIGSDGAAVSADGTRVAFTSLATNLGEGDTDEILDVYVKDLTTGSLTLASTSDTGTKGNRRSSEPTLSADGTRVAFESLATNLGEGGPGQAVYVKDLTTGALTLASASDTGTPANSGAYGPTLSASGTRIAFSSFATNLGEDDAGFVESVYVKDLTTGAVTLASTSDTGTKGNGTSRYSSISTDGTKVAFASGASNLGEGDTDTGVDVFVKDLTTGALRLASTSDTGTKGNDTSDHPSLSANGTLVAFESLATNLGEGETDTRNDIYVKDLATGAIMLASTSDTGNKANHSSVLPHLSADGTRVAFSSLGTNLGEGDTEGFYDAYVKELPGSSAPSAANDASATTAGSTLTAPAPGVLANDTDADPGDTLRASVVTGPSHGTLALAVNGGFTYTPATGYLGPDSFTYQASDGSNSSAPATVSLTVRSVNHDPVASAGEDQTVAHNADFTLSGSGSDVDGDDVTSSWTQISGPVAVIRDPDSPETVVEGVDGAATLVFRLTVIDPSGASGSDDVTVTVNPK